MANQKHTPKTGKISGFVIGRARFEKISAVEGIKLSSDMKKRAQEFDRRGLSAEERRKAIISKHRKD